MFYIYNTNGHFLWGIQDDGNSYPNSTKKKPDTTFVENPDFDVIFNKETQEWEYINKKPLESTTLETQEPTEEEIKAQEEEMNKAHQEYLKNLASEIYPFLQELQTKELKKLAKQAKSLNGRGKNAN